MISPSLSRTAVPLALAVTLLLGPARAHAQAEPAPFAPPAASAELGAQGQWVLSLGATSAPYLSFRKQGGDWVLALNPAIDTFIAPHVSVGGAVTYQHSSAGTGYDVVGLTARAGYSLPVTERVGFWPLGMLGVQHQSGNHASSTATLFTLYAPFLFHIVPHLFVGAGPSFTLFLSGGNDSVFGIDTLLGGWF
jgi:hypothetical protein